MQEKFHIETLHRGRFIWVLLGGLFVAGYLLSLIPFSEIVKILVLLFCIPVLMWIAVRVNRATSVWQITEGNIRITWLGKTREFSCRQISYLKNHTRSGGNLLVFYFIDNSAPVRLWRNKLFVPDDQFDDVLAQINALEIAVVPG